MSEILQGALIGIGGAIVGAVITAIISYINNKSQVELRIYELRSENLIRSREKVLVPLREALAESVEYANKALKMMVRMKGAYKRKEEPKRISEEISRWKEASEKSVEFLTRMEILRSQVSDSGLYNMIEEVNKSVDEENPKIIAAVMSVQDTKVVSLEMVQAVAKELGEARKRIFDKLLPVNKRIEELLSGE